LVDVGDGVPGDALGEGDGVVVAAACGDAHDAVRARTNRSGYARIQGHGRIRGRSVFSRMTANVSADTVSEITPGR
jgi:hypothetical protein